MPEMRSPKMSRSPETPDEFNYDPLKMYLYKKAIRTGKERESSIRVNIIGNFSQGKTSLTRRLIGQNCEGVTSTNGIEIRRFKCRKMKGGRLKLAEDENKDFFDRIAAVARSVDTEKLSERVERTALADTQNNQAVSAITEDHTFSYEPTQSQIVNTPISSQEPSVRQTVNIPTTSQEPTDDRSVTSNVQEQVVNTTQIPSISSEDFKTFSSGVDQEKDDVELSFDMWDFGGKYIFYATHTLFHSRKALYLLVVDLSSPLDKIVIDNEFPAESGEKNMEYFIKFWIESIHAFVGPGPPVILVGTHKDQIQGTDEAKQYLDQIRSIFKGTDMIDHIQPQAFAVDNHDFSDTEIPNLLQYLIQKGSELVQTVEIPARWIHLEKILNQHRHKNVITFQDIIKIDADNEYPLRDEQQLKLFLQYHHEKGTIFYFDEEPMSNHVVLDPGFLIDAFKCIITPERFRLNDISIRPLWCSLRDEAKLTDELINKVWSHNNVDFMKHKMVLLGYLKKHCIISQVVEYDITRGTYEAQDWYIVPSFLKDRCLRGVMEDFLRGKSRTRVRYFMQFEQTSIVQMLFHRLISTALGKWAILKFGNKLMVFKNLAVFKLQESFAGIAELQYSGIELRVVSLCNTKIGSQVPNGFRRFIEAVVTHEFRKLKSQMGDNAKPFSQKYRCNHKIHDLGGSLQISDIYHLLEKNSVFCPDSCTHTEVSGSEAKTEWFQDESCAIVYPKKILTEKHLGQLAQAAIGKGWQCLGLELGITKNQIDHIMEENSQVVMMIFQMLLNWKANSKDNATLDVLVESIKKCPSVTVAWDELLNIKDEHSGILMSVHSVFSQPLQDLTVKENDTMFLECEVSKPDVQVIWLKDNEEIYTEIRRRKCVEKHVHRLIVDDVTNTDAGVYKCLYEDICTTCIVTVQERQTPTEFLQTLSDICIEDKSGSASFQCKVNKASVDVKWYHGFRVLSPSEKYQLIDEGPIHILKIHNVVDTDEGKYHIVADGQTSSAMLYIEDTEDERELIRQYLAEKRKSEDSEGLLEQKRTRLHISEEQQQLWGKTAITALTPIQPAQRTRAITRLASYEQGKTALSPRQLQLLQQQQQNVINRQKQQAALQQQQQQQLRTLQKLTIPDPLGHQPLKQLKRPVVQGEKTFKTVIDQQLVTSMEQGGRSKESAGTLELTCTEFTYPMDSERLLEQKRARLHIPLEDITAQRFLAQVGAMGVGLKPRAGLSPTQSHDGNPNQSFPSRSGSKASPSAQGQIPGKDKRPNSRPSCSHEVPIIREANTNQAGGNPDALDLSQSSKQCSPYESGVQPRQQTGAFSEPGMSTHRAIFPHKPHSSQLHMMTGKKKDQTFRCLKMKEIEQLWSAGIETRSVLLKECERICAFIKNKSDRILNVWPAYDTSEEGKMVFVVLATGDVKVEVSYRTHIRIVDHYSEEGKCVMQSRKSAENRLSASQSEKICNVIDLYADTLMQNHRYISVITGSGVRSVGFATRNEEIIPEVCVVVYVLIKGKIPLEEKEIPKTLDGIPVDIREGGFQTNVLTASDYHKNVRMGCQIMSSANKQVCGTLGGFIEHQEYGLCGITCAHVVMNEQYIHDLRGKNKSVENEGFVYQPDTEQQKHRVGPIREVAYKTGGDGVPGIDLAVFQIDTRPPERGNFPGTSNAETNLLYESGNVSGDKQFNIYDQHVVKFGRTSGLTEGFVEFCNTGVRKIDYDREYTVGTKRYTYTLFSQLEIRPSNNGRPFNERGDSGALVFKKDVTGSLICIGMVVGGYSNGNGIVTPISAIKRELGVLKLKNFTENKIDKIERRMQTMEQSLQEIKSTLANLVSNNK